MTQYLFVLGRNPDLSILEILAYCKRKNIKYKLEEYKEDIAMLELEGFDEQSAINDLGGTIKIARPLENWSYRGTKNKIVYAVNYYRSDPQQIDKKIKQMLAAEELKVTRRHGKTKNIDPSKGRNLDIEFLAYHNQLFLVSVTSNPKEYKQRDATRPAYNPLKVISIRLAKILINLAEAKEEIFDPFCGQGTILQEALLMGYVAWGVDLDDRDARKNLEWLEQKYPKLKGRWQVIPGSATDLRHFKKIETVVTEPELGPFHRGYPSIEEAKEIAYHLKNLYRGTLLELAKKVTGKVIIIFPELKTRQKIPVNLDIPSILAKTGFKIVTSLPNVQVPIPYFDSKDKINRYIYILEKK